MGEDRIRALAHRMAWRYKKAEQTGESDLYTFNDLTLQDFVAALIKSLGEEMADRSVHADGRTSRTVTFNQLGLHQWPVLPKHGGKSHLERKADRVAASESPTNEDSSGHDGLDGSMT